MDSMASQITRLTFVYSAVYFGRRSKKISKFRVIGLCAGNSPGTGELPAQMASNAKNVSIWWRHHDEVDAIGMMVSTRCPKIRPESLFGILVCNTFNLSCSETGIYRETCQYRIPLLIAL